MDAEDAWFRGSAGRVTAMVVVLVVHMAGFVFVTLPTAPFRQDRRDRHPQPDRAIRVRLIPASPRAPRAAVAVQRRHGMPRPHPARRTSRSTVATPAPPPREVRQPVSAPLDLSLPSATPRAADGGALVGRNLGQPRTRPRYRLPGGGHVAGAPRLHLADPRTQGVAGVVRALQGLFGVPDPHCIDVDSWRGMTREERFAHHVTDDDIERTAEQHGCVPMQRHPDPPGTPRPPWVPPGH